ncbi:cytochrome c oxidase subunit II [Nitriliruptoria bacterium AS10]|nr:cytochrome c oxidase subunit II [Salsipaludibacter albus]
MADLWWLMFWLGLAVFVVFAVMLVLALFRRRGEEPEARSGVDVDEDDTTGRLARWFLGWGVIGPGVVITVVFVATVAAMKVLPTTAAPDDLVIEVVGHQWYYEVTYPDHGVTTTDELHLPVGRQVALQLTSADVIHSFWVPELGGKLDMMPDRVNTLVLQADEPGEHTMRCAEFCGLDHATMMMPVVAESDADFDAWIADLAGNGSGDG